MIEKTSGMKNPITLRRVLPIAAVLVFAAVFFTAPVVAADEHTHTGWIAWGDGSNGETFNADGTLLSLPTSGGNYYLTKDVLLSETWTNANGIETKLCLNGHSIKQEGTNKRIIKVPSGTTLSLYSCDQSTEHKFHVSDGTDGSPKGLWILSTTGEKTVNGGVITGGNFDADSTEHGAGISVEGTLHLDNVHVIGNYLKNPGYHNGGGIYVAGSGTVNMNGGSISGNCVAGNGGGVMLYKTARMTMTGVTVENNSAGLTGGGIHVYGGYGHVVSKLTLENVEITGNHAKDGGGIAHGGALDIRNVLISENVAEENGGGLHYTNLYSQTTSLAGNVQITDNWKGGEQNNVYLNNNECSCMFTVTDALSETSSIGITFSKLPVDGSPVQITTEESGDNVKYFSADDKTQFHITKDEDGNVVLESGETLPTTITFNTDDGSTIEPITQVPGTDVTVPEDPTKDGFIFIGWNPSVPKKMPNEDLTVTAQWEVRDLGDTFSYTLAEPTVKPDANTVTFPINFASTNAAMVPTSWEITVTVKDGGTDVTSAETLTYALTGDSQYVLTPAVDEVAKNIFRVTASYGDGATPVPTSSNGLFTLTITGVPVIETDYTVTIDIRTYVSEEGKLSRYSDAVANAEIPPVWLLKESSNIYKDGVGVTTPWDMTNKVEATYEVANLKVNTYTSDLKDELVTRGAYSLSLTKSGTVTITKVTADGEKPVDETTKIAADATGNIVMTIAQADQNDAEYFIIKFVGNRVGDVEYAAEDEKGIIDVLDVDYILHQTVMPDGKCYFSNSNYLVYADVDHDGDIDEEDARLTFKTASHKTLDETEKKAVWMYTPTAP